MGSRHLQHQPVLAWGRLGGAEVAVGGEQDPEEGAELDSCVQELGEIVPEPLRVEDIVSEPPRVEEKIRHTAE